ncbi:MAG TPA: endonuclease/exonuclease/phosphatase family protein [Chthoniobacterales bacterium]|nr:endonuclease/exonuclease/phosphatase family protein [Chthoniobacterales bacterium]
MDSALADVNGPRPLRVATYNVHGCVGIDGRRSEARIAEVIASLKADIVGLQELDLGRARSAGVDQARLIAEQLGWSSIFEAAMRHGQEHYGNAIISRYPLRLHRVCQLTGRGTWYCRETRVALWVEAQTEHGLVHVVNTHFGLGRAEGFRQAEQLASADWLGGAVAHLPLILLGDFNSVPGWRAHRALAKQLLDLRAHLNSGRHRTFPTRLPLFAVDHILVNAALRPLSMRVHRDPVARIASDHFPLVAELAL